MELKVGNEGNIKVKKSRFNRTLMELKACRDAATFPIPLFQSHLYGIERRLL